MKDRTIEVRDHRLYGRIGEVYLAVTPFTPPDSLSDIKRAINELDFITPKRVRHQGCFDLVAGFRFKRPCVFEISRNQNGKVGVLSIQTGGYDCTRELLEDLADLADRLGLITDFVTDSLVYQTQSQMSQGMSQDNVYMNSISENTKLSLEDSFGALTYADFLHKVMKRPLKESLRTAGERYGFDFVKVLDKIKETNHTS
ncbi:MAG: hypothetical protein AABX35_02105 [Nanoarchaeota archaeon]